MKPRKARQPEQSFLGTAFRTCGSSERNCGRRKLPRLSPADTPLAPHARRGSPAGPPPPLGPAGGKASPAPPPALPCPLPPRPPPASPGTGRRRRRHGSGPNVDGHRGRELPTRPRSVGLALDRPRRRERPERDAGTWAMKTTCFPLNFFSSSRTSRTWIFWKDFSCGTGTKMMMAFRPPPTSISWRDRKARALLGPDPGARPPAPAGADAAPVPASRAPAHLGGRDVQLAQLGLEVRVHLQLQEGLRGEAAVSARPGPRPQAPDPGAAAHLGDARLELVRLLAIGLHDLRAGAEHGLDLEAQSVQAERPAAPARPSPHKPSGAAGRVIGRIPTRGPQTCAPQSRRTGMAPGRDIP